MAGTIAASVNGQGVVGVAPSVRIMALNFLGCANGGAVSQEVKAIEYAKKMGAMISNNSYGAPGFVQSEKDAIEASGQLFVAAAGNSGLNNDTSPNRDYPAAYNSPNILSIAAVNNRGNLASFSNYGATSVDVSTPGVDILSTVPGNAYAYYDGTSMATPQATGVTALAASADSALLADPVALKNHLMVNGKPAPATVGKTVTGKMVNAKAATAGTTESPPPPTGDDTTPPEIDSRTPDSGAKRVSRYVDVTATFSEDIDENTVNTANVELYKNGSGSAINAAVSCDNPCRTATLTPSSRLASRTWYMVVIWRNANGVKDLAGNSLSGQGEYVYWWFKTRR